MENETINLLYLRTTVDYLPKEELSYFVSEQLDNTYEIKKVPPVYKNFLSTVYYKMAYDYDTLNLENQQLYKDKYRKMKRNSNGTYYEATKEYIKKK